MQDFVILFGILMWYGKHDLTYYILNMNLTKQHRVICTRDTLTLHCLKLALLLHTGECYTKLTDYTSKILF